MQLHSVIYAVFIAAVVFLGSGCPGPHGLSQKTASGSPDLFDEALSLIAKHYITRTGGKVRVDASVRPDISRLVAQLDNAKLVTREETELSSSRKRGAVGISVDMKDEVPESRSRFYDAAACSPGRRQYGFRRGNTRCCFARP